jgi:hypothetical protein
VRANPITSCAGCTDQTVRASLPFEQQCSPCRKKERNRLWRESNPGAMAANAKRWREAGNKSQRPEGYAEQHRTYSRERYHTDPVVQAATKAANEKRRREKPEEVREAMRRWQEANPEKLRTIHLRHVAKIGVVEKHRQDKELRKRHRVPRQARQAEYNAKRYGGDGIITTSIWLRCTSGRTIAAFIVATR